MSEIVLDECLYYLREADNYLSLYQEMDPFEEIFEAYKPETQLKVAQNEKAKTGVMGSLTKACQALLKMIENIIDSIKDFFAKRNLDKETRAAYEAFKAKAAKDPQLKNKKITVQDFTKLNDEYNKLLKEAAAADKELANGKDLNLNNLFSKFTHFGSHAVKGVAVSVGMEAALNIASSSQEIAKNIYTSLQNDKALQSQLIDAVGQKETKRFEKQMKALSKRVSLQRELMKMKKTYSTSVEDAINNTFDTVWSIVDSVKNLAGTAGDLDPNVAVQGNVFQRAAHTASYIGKNFGTLAKDGGNAAIKGGDMVRRMMGNETINSLAKNTMKERSQATKDARAAYQQTKKAEKQALRNSKKKVPTHGQSAMDSLFSKNDPSTTTRKFLDKFRIK